MSKKQVMEGEVIPHAREAVSGAGGYCPNCNCDDCRHVRDKAYFAQRRNAGALLMRWERDDEWIEWYRMPNKYRKRHREEVLEAQGIGNNLDVHSYDHLRRPKWRERMAANDLWGARKYESQEFVVDVLELEVRTIAAPLQIGVTP